MNSILVLAVPVVEASEDSNCKLLSEGQFCQ